MLVFIGNKFIGLTFNKLKEKFIIKKIRYTINIIFAAIVIDFIPFIASNVLNIKKVNCIIWILILVRRTFLIIKDKFNKT